MINDVRNTVLAIMNKDNNGYLTPDQFNLYAKQAQLEIFESYFYSKSNAVNKTNAHMHTSGLGDISKRLSEVIERFTVEGIPVWNGTTLRYTIPTDAYSLGTVTYLATGVEIEHMAHNKILNLNSSMDTAPSTTYPVYTIIASEMQVYPNTITTTGQVVQYYVRYPADPKWTYNGLSGGEPIFNQSAGDYQDFEISKDDENNLIEKILQFAGTQIREPEIVQSAKTDEVQEKQEQL